jgi:poly(3-hydroxybutyrate) depolymerase
MLEYFNSKLCIDQTRIFSLGFSFGGMMSNAIGCEMANVFRAIAPMSGALYSGCTQTNEQPIAVWMAHGTTDNVVPLDDGKAALAVFLERNGCSAQTMPTQPSPCVEYQGCAAGYPVHYCEFNGGHGPQGFAPDATWDFFSQF